MDVRKKNGRTGRKGMTGFIAIRKEYTFLKGNESLIGKFTPLKFFLKRFVFFIKLINYSY